VNIAEVITLYGLVPKVPRDEILAVINTLFMAIDIPDVIGDLQRRALGFLIESAMDNLFE
jgi:hypothetical protein